MTPLKLLAKYEIPASVQGRFVHLTADVARNRIVPPKTDAPGAVYAYQVP